MCCLATFFCFVFIHIFKLCSVVICLCCWKSCGRVTLDCVTWWWCLFPDVHGSLWDGHGEGVCGAAESGQAVQDLSGCGVREGVSVRAALRHPVQLLPHVLPELHPPVALRRAVPEPDPKVSESVWTDLSSAFSDARVVWSNAGWLCAGLVPSAVWCRSLSFPACTGWKTRMRRIASLRSSNLESGTTETGLFCGQVTK